MVLKNHQINFITRDKPGGSLKARQSKRTKKQAKAALGSYFFRLQQNNG
jgi:hypothetical protein